MRMWLLIYSDGTFMTWTGGKPENQDYQEYTRCFRVLPTMTLKEVSDWVAEGYPREMADGFEIKEW